MKLYFYRGKGKLFDKLVRIWTSSKYSHVECVIENNTYTANFDGVKRIKYKYYDPKEWDMIQIGLRDYKKAESFLVEQVGKKYDFKGIFLTFIFPFKSHNRDKWFCSELCAEVLKRDNFELSKRSSRYSPKGLFKELYKIITEDY